MSNENIQSIDTNESDPFKPIYDSAIQRSLKYSQLIGSALGTLKAISIISLQPEVKKYASEKYDEIQLELKELYK